MLLRFFLVALLVLPHLAGAQTISFTFDDGFDPRKDPRAIEWNRALLAALTKHQVEAMLFPAGRNVNAESGLELAKDWARAGHAIGNHTFSHRSLGSARVTLADFIEDVQVADRMLRNLAHWTPMLRFPYLKEGETREKRDGMRAWMRAHAYRAAPVSIDTSDWYYNERYLQLLQQGRDQRLPILREAYLAHLKSKALYYDELARAALARSPAHVMLLHTNAINAAWAGDMIEMFKAMGWQIVQPATAFADPLYARQSQTLPAGESIVWALAKETGLAGLRYPAEDGEYEKPLLDRLGL